MDNQTLYNEINGCLMRDAKPSERLSALSGRADFEHFPFYMLARLKKTQQSALHHPEGNAWVHTLMVVDEAARLKEKSTNVRVFMWAALLHDIGKPETTKVRRGKITSYDHDKAGAELSRRFLAALTDESDLISGVYWLVRYHMHILYVVGGLPYANVPDMSDKTNIRDLALLGYCDRLGRAGADKKDELDTVFLFLKKCNERIDTSWLRQE